MMAPDFAPKYTMLKAIIFFSFGMMYHYSLDQWAPAVLLLSLAVIYAFIAWRCERARRS